ncbi:MAG TPA: riboflavin synthase [Proteobacteria bacterium]|nr:riboflavin synthase [Pseudomonadota bacterium]
MFTGIIEETGTVSSSSLSGGSGDLRIEARLVLGDCAPGDSIAVNGVCLTVTQIKNKELNFAVSAETLRRSNLGLLKKGARVNLERALAADGRFGGHLVSGHIDGTGRLSHRQAEGNAVIFTFTAPPAINRYLIEKGSIAVDGISLTIASLNRESFKVAVIPHSLTHTTLAKKEIGAIVNLESDLIAKYIEKLLQPRDAAQETGASGLNLSLLRKHGFA